MYCSLSAPSFLSFLQRCGCTLRCTANKIRLWGGPRPSGSLCVWNRVIENSCKRNCWNQHRAWKTVGGVRNYHVNNLTQAVGKLLKPGGETIMVKSFRNPWRWLLPSICPQCVLPETSMSKTHGLTDEKFLVHGEVRKSVLLSLTLLRSAILVSDLQRKKRWERTFLSKQPKQMYFINLPH